MLTLSPIKILIVVVVALLLVGPDKLPQLARQIGGAWKAFRNYAKQMEDDMRNSMPDLPSTGDIARFARSPVALLDSLAKISDTELEPDPGVEGTDAGDELKPDPGAPAPKMNPPVSQERETPKTEQFPPGDPNLN
ncbi:MAG: twin-arginine translocase TatA/TatE family subunit [Actinomycetes bacterium]